MESFENLKKQKEEIVAREIADMELGIINRLFLELSQFATAKTRREIELERQLASARADEREQCAIVADELFHSYSHRAGLYEYDENISAAIRSRAD